MDDLSTRLNTFKQNINGFSWPFNEALLTPEKMASAGLFFCPDKKSPDAVKCFKCGGKLAGFALTDDPTVDHKTYYPKCSLSVVEDPAPISEVAKKVENCSVDDLPEGWAQAKAPNGRIYYWNKVTLETAWTKPKNVTQAAPAPKGTSEERVAALPKNKSFPASVYTPWIKPGSSISSKLEEFGQQVGQTALECVTRLYQRHSPWNPRSRLTEPVSITWEDVWSSKAVGGTHSNGYTGVRDREGEQIVDILGRELRAKGIKFCDPTFPPTTESLFVYPSTAKKHVGVAAGDRIDTSAFLAGLDPDKNIQWKRPSEIYAGQSVKIWADDADDNINPDDVVQGRLGNCYYLSAICACAQSNGDVLLQDLIIEDYGDVGLYGVKFFMMGKWISVIVDDYFPMTNISVAGRSQDWSFIFSCPKRSSRVKEIWPMVMEKAWAKLHGSFECTDAGDNHDALEYLTGGVIKILQLSQNPGSISHFEVLKDVLSEHDDEDAFVGCGDCGYSQPKAQKSAACSKVGLVTGHAYAVLRAIEPKPGLRLVQVQNPWGSTEWNGKYSDKCPCWTEELKSLVPAFTPNNDGTFFMEWSDFSAWFGQCRIVDPRRLDKLSGDDLARVDGAAGTWVAGKSAGGPDPRSPTFQYNPTFELTGSTTPVLVTLYQPDTRHLAIYDTWPIQQGPYSEISLWFGERGYPKQKIHMIESDYRLATCSQDLNIIQGKVYEITVATDMPGLEGAFAFTACGKDVELKPLRFNNPPQNIGSMMAKREGRRWEGPNNESLSTFGV